MSTAVLNVLISSNFSNFFFLGGEVWTRDSPPPVNTLLVVWRESTVIAWAGIVIQ